MIVRLIQASLLLTLFGLGTAACTNKAPVVDTANTPWTDPNDGNTTPYNGATARRVDRGFRLLLDTAAVDLTADEATAMDGLDIRQ